MKTQKIKGLRFKKWLLQLILGKQMMYVIYICLYKSKMEAELVRNHIRRDFIENVMRLFDNND